MSEEEEFPDCPLCGRTLEECIDYEYDGNKVRDGWSCEHCDKHFNYKLEED